MANYRLQYRILLANRPVDLTLNSLRCNWTFVSLRSTLSARFRLLLSLSNFRLIYNSIGNSCYAGETYISKPTMELTFALDSAVKGLRDTGSPVLRRDMLMTASLQSSHFKCPLKKEKKNKQTNNISYSDVAYVAEDVLTYNLGQNGWEIYPPSPLPTKSRIGNGALWLLCGFILDLGGGLGFAVPFYYVQDRNLLKKNYFVQDWTLEHTY